MPGTDRVITFVVRIADSGTGFHAVVERVSTGRKEQTRTIEGIGQVIAAMVGQELVAGGSAEAAGRSTGEREGG